MVTTRSQSVADKRKEEHQDDGLSARASIARAAVVLLLAALSVFLYFRSLPPITVHGIMTECAACHLACARAHGIRPRRCALRTPCA